MRPGSQGERKRGFCFCSENRIFGCPSEKTRVRKGLPSRIPAGGFGAVCGRPTRVGSRLVGSHSHSPARTTFRGPAGGAGPYIAGPVRNDVRHGKDRDLGVPELCRYTRVGGRVRTGGSGQSCKAACRDRIAASPDPAGPARFAPAWGEEGQISPYGRRVGARPHGTNGCAARCVFWMSRAGGRPEPGRQDACGLLDGSVPAGGAAVWSGSRGPRT